MGHHIVNLPPQQLPFNKKTKEWRKKHLDWADGKTFFNHDLVRKSVIRSFIVMLISIFTSLSNIHSV